MSDSAITAFYNDIFADLTVDREEAAELHEFLTNLNPPPDKLTKLRATAFKTGSNFLTEDVDSNKQLMRTLNYIVHAIENVCLKPKELEDPADIDMEEVDTFYKSLFEDLSIDREENEELYGFFSSHPTNDLVGLRAAAFKNACDYFGEDSETNVNLLRCVNVIVHALETTYYTPVEYKLQEMPVDYGSMSMGEAVQKLWDLDVNRLTPGDDYVINVQSGKKPYWKEDAAADPLFTSVDRNVWKQRPTYSAFKALLDNYIAETGHKESVTAKERAEITLFLNAVYATAPMQFAHKYCVEHGKDVPSDKAGFLAKLRSVWFDLYRREGGSDSSGFEHVFLGEVKNGDVSGFHNWIQFYLQEQEGAVDYRGYIKPRGHGNPQQDDADFLLTLQFAWRGVEKFVGTSFIGVSPEFEMALYSMCFLCGEQENKVELNTGTDVYDLTIKCYSMRGKIGTTFPEVNSHYEEDE